MLELIQSFFSNQVISKSTFIIIVSALTVILANVIQWAMIRAYEKSAQKRRIKINKTKFQLLRRVLVLTIYILGFLLVLSTFPELKKISYSLFASAGILAIIIGFATQEIFSNLIGGFFISLFEPFRIDDRVKIGEEHGIVDDITAWHTVIKTFNNQRLMIPNSKIAKEAIMNYSIRQEETLNFIDFNISYDSSVPRARRIIGEELEKSQYYLDYQKHHTLLKKDEPYKVRVISLEDYSVCLRLYAWTQNATAGFFLKTEMLENVKARFDKEGVEIPFPYRTIVEKSNLSKPNQKA